MYRQKPTSEMKLVSSSTIPWNHYDNHYENQYNSTTSQASTWSRQWLMNYHYLPNLSTLSSAIPSMSNLGELKLYTSSLIIANQSMLNPNMFKAHATTRNIPKS